VSKKSYFFLFSIFFLAAAYIFMFRALSPELAWLAFPMGLLFLKWFDLSLLKGFYLLKTMPKERIKLNLKVAGVHFSNKSYSKALKIRAVSIFIAIISLFTYFLWNDFVRSYDYISQSLKTSKAILRVEYPSFSGFTPKYFNLTENKFETSVDTSSYVEIRIENLKSDDNWKITFTENDKIIPEKNFSYLIQSGLWSSSVSSLYSLFVDDKIQDQLYNANHKNPNLSSKNIQLVLTNKNKKYFALIKINPTSNPIVKLEPVQSESMEGSEALGKMNFSIDVASSVPLTLVELSVRTQSGYHFDKTLAEFANASEFSFNSDSAELVTLGIPFLPEDILYIKAVAKTVLSGIIGESKELVFPVKTPLQVRQDIIKNLEVAQKELKLMKNASAEQKEKAIVPLSKAAQLAGQISRSGVIRRNVIEAMNFVENISLRNDRPYQAALAKIQSTINILRRQQKINEAGNFLARLQSLKNNISLLQNKETDIMNAVSEANDLKEMAFALNEQLMEMSKNQTYSLSKNEKVMVQNLLKKDRTAEKMNKTAKVLQEKKIPEAQQEIQSAVDEGNNHLGFAMQIMQQARQRAIQEARTKLQDSDSLLEGSKFTASKPEILSKISKAKESLEKTPQLGGEFNESLNEAKNATKKAFRFGQENRSLERVSSTQIAQESIEKAILSLQDEEESDKELQKEQDARAFRSSMDILAAQGVVDSSWRKKILEEIANLKSQGDPSDSPMIRYLESRLR
jgi:hypothetical protein